MSTRNDYRDAAEICRERGWTAGTRLVGDEGYGLTVIEIRFVGERVILAVQVSHNGVPACYSDERSWGLSARDWQVVPS